MVRDEKLKKRWNILLKKISDQFNNGEVIGVSRLLSQYGYYEFCFIDNDGWPHYIVKEQLPNLTSGEQKLLMKQAIVNYFLEKGYIN